MIGNFLKLGVVVGIVLEILLVSLNPGVAEAQERERAIVERGRVVLARARSFSQRVFRRPRRVPDMQVDWGTGVIRATGRGALPPTAETYPQAKLMALAAAELDAERAIVATLHGARLRSRRRADRHILTDYVVEEAVEGSLKGVRVVGTRTLSDGNIEVDMELRLVKQKTGRRARPPFVAVPGKAPEPKPRAETVPGRVQGWKATDYYIPTQDVLGRTGDYTGLIVNARNLHLTPAICPKVFDEEGNELYPDPDNRALARVLKGKHIPVTYMPSIEAALKSPRIGDNPLIIDAVAARGDANTDVVIAREDLEKLAKLANYAKILEEGHVIFVVD